jgi:hypothetical protein
MTRLNISPAASALFRALAGRAGVSRDRILLTEARSVEWQSLTFTGERHHISLRVPAPDSAEIVRRMCTGLRDAEFSIPGILVADIGALGAPRHAIDGSVELTIEALTITLD